jgi:hypothetical protein
MRQPAAFLLAGLLAACSVQPPPPPAPAPQASEQPVPKRQPAGQPANRHTPPQPSFNVAAPVCRLGPDNGPLIADRGIGGTGAPATGVVASKSADTSSVAFTQLAERGIGGTGIVGVITGFASVCVNGLEVAYDPAIPVDRDGTAANASSLRAGQVVVIQAEGPPDALHARTISLRHEVSGRIEAVELGSGLLTIAGQPVAIPSGTWGADRFSLGDWVAVSGLQRADGVIVASRLDQAPAGRFTAHGRVVRDGSTAALGRLDVTERAAGTLQDGQFMTVSGIYVDGAKQVVALESDILAANPAAYFGKTVNMLSMQAFVRPSSGGMWLNGMKLAGSANLKQSAGPDNIAVVALKRRADGTFDTTGMTATDFRVHPTGAEAPSSSILDSTPAANPPEAHQPPEAAGTREITSFQPPPPSAYVPPSRNRSPASSSTTSLASLPVAPLVAALQPGDIGQITGTPGSASNSPTSLAPVGSAAAGALAALAGTATPGSSPTTATAPIQLAPPSVGGIPAPAPPVLAPQPPPVLAMPMPLPSVPLATPSMPPAPTFSPILPLSPVIQPVQPLIPTPGPGPTPIESLPAPLISLNNTGSILPSRSVHARSITGTTTRSSLSLTNTVGVATASRPGIPTPDAARLPGIPLRAPTTPPGNAGRH